MPRQSNLRTTAALLRSIIGLSVDEMASLVDSTHHTIKSVEAGTRLKLSPSLAARMAAGTGISEQWLLAGDVKKTPTTPSGTYFTRKIFERHAAAKNALNEAALTNDVFRGIQMAARLSSIMKIAKRSGKIELFNYKADQALGALAKEFGEDKEDSASVQRCVEVIESAIDEIRTLSKKMGFSALFEKPGMPWESPELRDAFAELRAKYPEDYEILVRARKIHDRGGLAPSTGQRIENEIFDDAFKTSLVAGLRHDAANLRKQNVDTAPPTARATRKRASPSA